MYIILVYLKILLEIRNFIFNQNMRDTSWEVLFEMYFCKVNLACTCEGSIPVQVPAQESSKVPYPA